MKKIIGIIIPLFMLSTVSHLPAENYLLNGGQRSKIHYTLIQKVEPTEETVTVNLSYVLPENFSSATYSQSVSDLVIDFSLEPESKREWTDKRGNRVIDYSWNNPPGEIKARISFITENLVSLKPVSTTAPFPLKGLNAEQQQYLNSTKLVPAGDERIRAQSAEIVSGSNTEFEAVQRVLSWVIDHMRYVLEPEEFGALYSLDSGRGNCQNYSHLAAALLRAQGIPVRIVNGITLKEPYDIETGNQRLTLNMAQGRHSWIEIFFPDLGWMPFDPQQSELFVSNRFIRLEVGLDNEETLNDGLVRWTRKKGSQGMISFAESIEANFSIDDVSLQGEKQLFGPRNILLMPAVQASFVPEARPPKKEQPIFDPASLRDLKFDMPFVYGNLEFPEGVNFAFSRSISSGADEDSKELKKNFLVETAEYISGPSDFTQMFLLDKPVLLENIGLALHKFGGQGGLVLELREDDNGKPGKVAALSQSLDISSMTGKTGYHWVDFDFSSQDLVMTPDAYWITIKFTGSPIINWFYSYGKPVGPVEGTKMKLKKEMNWTHTLGYEFNYRIVGKTIE